MASCPEKLIHGHTVCSIIIALNTSTICFFLYIFFLSIFLPEGSDEIIFFHYVAWVSGLPKGLRSPFSQKHLILRVSTMRTEKLRCISKHAKVIKRNKIVHLHCTTAKQDFELFFQCHSMRDTHKHLFRSCWYLLSDESYCMIKPLLFFL